MTTFHTPRRDAGFTLVELLVVLGILSLLAAFAAPTVLGYLGRARTEAARTQIAALSNALDQYALDMGGYPSNDQGLKALLQAPAGATRWSGPYLRRAEGLTDPWGKPYQYTRTAPTGPFQIISFGADQARGGSGEAQDVTN